jgi:sirohydrochlorin ferrochelatase
MPLAVTTTLLALLLLSPPHSSPPHPVRAEASVGLLVVAHGADSGWNARVEQVVEAVEWEGPRAVAFLMGPEADVRGWSVALGELESAGISRLVVVPLMVSSSGGHYRQVLHYAGLVDSLPEALISHGDHGSVRHPTVPARVTAALDGARELGEVMLTRWRDLADADRASDLVLVAHGPSDDRDAVKWHAALDSALTPLGAELGQRQFRIGLLRDDAPASVRARAVEGIRDTIQELARRGGDSVVVMTVLISSGSIDRVRVPDDLAGMPMRYRPSVLSPHPALSRWIARVAAADS